MDLHETDGVTKLTYRLALGDKAGRDHIAYEQDVVWPAFQAAVSQDELDKLGGKLEAAKKIAPTRPHPDTPPNPAVLTHRHARKTYRPERPSCRVP